MGEPTDDGMPTNSIHLFTVQEWRAWLEANHTRTEGIWLIRYKPATGKPRIKYEESVKKPCA